MSLSEIIFTMLVAAAAMAVQVSMAAALRCAVAFMLGLAQELTS